MRIVIVDRDPESLAPLTDQLRQNSFEVTILENSAGVLSFIKKKTLQFLIADASLLIGHTLGQEVRRLTPLARLIVLAAHPSLLGLIEAVSGGVTDYFPRQPEFFNPLVATVVAERQRLLRWQHALLDGDEGRGALPSNESESVVEAETISI